MAIACPQKIVCLSVISGRLRSRQCAGVDRLFNFLCTEGFELGACKLKDYLTRDHMIQLSDPGKISCRKFASLPNLPKCPVNSTVIGG